jgi:hypothetical protein
MMSFAIEPTTKSAKPKRPHRRHMLDAEYQEAIDVGERVFIDSGGNLDAAIVTALKHYESAKAALPVDDYIGAEETHEFLQKILHGHTYTPDDIISALEGILRNIATLTRPGELQYAVEQATMRIAAQQALTLIEKWRTATP